MATQLTQMPDSFRAGTTLSYVRTYADYTQAAGWTLAVVLAGPAIANDTGSDAGGGVWTFSLAAAATAGLVAGHYTWLERATHSGGEVVDLNSGFVTVLPNLATATAGSAQSWEERMLPEVEAAIADILSGKIQSYTIAGRGAEKLGLEELRKLRGELVAAIRTQRTGRVGRQHLVNFRKASG